jgi:arylsulfatase A-like enzyme
MTRRAFLASAAAAAQTAAPARPNVILIMSDDQGYGDLSIHGNTHLQTPHIDRIAREGAQFTQFQVCPVCSPTRASLLTGRYNYRTGIVDTFKGRSMMDPREQTAAELFAAAGYKTGIFCKWHLGDNYPMRAHDQGFGESLVHGGGGLSQPSDPPPGNHYFNPTLLRNGKFEKVEGYCTDIFFREAIRFIEQNQTKPFFLYLPTNAPHTPLEVAAEYVAPFQNKGLDDTTAKVYGMVKNLDDNVGRLLTVLQRTRLEANTILIFMTDNGPQQPRYVAGMRGLKGSVYQGGIRVPFFLRWPGRFAAGAKVDRIAAHIDVLPTLLEACAIRPAQPPRFDGRNLMPLLQTPAAAWPDRVIHTQWHRGDQPQIFRNHAARSQRWKLTNGTELYDMQNDPGETRDLSTAQPGEVARLRAATEAWFGDVSSTRGGYAPPRIYIGVPEENPTLLTLQDRRDEPEGWELDVRAAARYQITLLFKSTVADGEARLSLGRVEEARPVRAGVERCIFDSVAVPAGEARLAARVMVDGKPVEVRYVEVRKMNG